MEVDNAVSWPKRGHGDYVWPTSVDNQLPRHLFSVEKDCLESCDLTLWYPVRLFTCSLTRLLTHLYPEERWKAVWGTWVKLSFQTELHNAQRAISEFHFHPLTASITFLIWRKILKKKWKNRKRLRNNWKMSCGCSGSNDEIQRTDKRTCELATERRCNNVMFTLRFQVP